MAEKKRNKAYKEKLNSTKNSTTILFYFGSYAHPYYKPLLECPPEGYTYISSIPVTSTQKHGKQASFTNAIRQRLVLPIVKAVGYPKIYSVHAPRNAKGIHAAQYLLKTKTSYVTDFEDATVFTWYDYTLLNKKRTRTILINAMRDKSLKFILPWTEASRKSLENAFSLPDDVRKKIRVVYPCYIAKTRTPKKQRKGITRFLFVGKLFYEKGGLETIRAFIELRKRIPTVELTVVSTIPKEIRVLYNAIPGLLLAENLTQVELDAAYKNADVFIMPTHYDTFGLVYLEAMSYGLPCIGTRNFAVPEIIEEGKSGLLVRNHCSRFNNTYCAVANAFGKNNAVLLKSMAPPLSAVHELSLAMENLARNPALRERLGRGGHASITTGRFSVAAHERTLKKIYDEAFTA